VRSVNTSFVLRTKKFTTRLPLDATGAAATRARAS
jgi:hypothetical protein